jgi:NAD-dependent dihydropyrimidine dehydrogenase PreA subunit
MVEVQGRVHGITQSYGIYANYVFDSYLCNPYCPTNVRFRAGLPPDRHSEPLVAARAAEFAHFLGAVMTFVIAQPCIGVKDTACIAVCPVDCIYPTKDEVGFATAEMLYIDPGSCTDCGLCEGECPVNAIFQDADLPAEWRHFIEKNAAHFRVT